MSFNIFLLIFICFVLIPEILRKYAKKIFDGKENKWPDIKSLLDLIFGKMPKARPEFEHIIFKLASAFAVFLLYFEIIGSLMIAGILSVVMMVFGFLCDFFN